MHGLSASVNLSFLEGLVVEEVAVGPYDVQLRMEGREVVVSIVGSATAADERHRAGPALGRALVDLAGRTVERVQNPGTGELTIRFSGGFTTTLHEDEGPYESYTISGGPEGIIVV